MQRRCRKRRRLRSARVVWQQARAECPERPRPSYAVVRRIVAGIDPSMATLAHDGPAAYRDRFTPLVVGITGSIAKTSTKEQIAAVLDSRFTVLRNEGNENNEIGLPLTAVTAPNLERLKLVMKDLGILQ